jgi:hypothetical protein
MLQHLGPIPTQQHQQVSEKKETMPIVRLATMEDLPRLLKFCEQLHEENGISKIDWDVGVPFLVQGIRRQGAIVGVIGPVGAIEGMVFLQFSRFWYSKDDILDELFNYVAPEYRRSNNAKALAKFAKDCSEKIDIPLLIGILSNIRTEGKIRLYRSIFGPPSGAYFLINAKE